MAVLGIQEFARPERFNGERFEDGRGIFEEVTIARGFPSFLTLPAYTKCVHEAGQRSKAAALNRRVEVQPGRGLGLPSTGG